MSNNLEGFYKKNKAINKQLGCITLKHGQPNHQISHTHNMMRKIYDVTNKHADVGLKQLNS